MEGMCGQPGARGSSVDAAIAELHSWSDDGGPGPRARVRMAERLAAIERRYAWSDSAELSYWLGVTTWRYVLWHVRGGARRRELERALRHFEQAVARSAGRLPLCAPGARLDRVSIACGLGALLVEEESVRDLDSGIAYLDLAFRTTPRYDPALCSYANGLYRRGDYQQAAGVALELHRRALDTPEWRGRPPHTPIEIAAKSFRALARLHRRSGEGALALVALRRLAELDGLGAGDQRLLAQLRATAPALGRMARAVGLGIGGAAII